MSAPKLKPKSNQANNLNVKHVPAYPIEVTLMKAEGQPGSKGHIVKLVEHGFMMKIEVGLVFKVADEWFVSFETPATHKRVNTVVKVMKTYDAYEIREIGKVKVYTVEMHFKDLSADHREIINEYLVKSGQKKRAFI